MLRPCKLKNLPGIMEFTNYRMEICRRDYHAVQNCSMRGGPKSFGPGHMPWVSQADGPP
jgi:hypothetical protein